MEEQRQGNITQRKMIETQEEKVDYLENQSRRDNLVFTGIKEKSGETWDDCIDEVVKVAEQIGVVLKKEDIVRAHRVNRKKKTPRNIVAKFTSWRKKEEMLKNKRHLKGSSYYIFEDFSVNTTMERQVLLEETIGKGEI